jgi:hypothetical protein
MAPDAPRYHFGTGHQTHDYADALKRRKIDRVNKRAPAGCDYRWQWHAGLRAEIAIGRDRGHDFALKRAEMLLSVVAENLRNGLARARNEPLVGIDQTPPQTLRQRASYRRLASRHEPGEDYLRRHQLSLIELVAAFLGL